jgi:hypothetical protein
MHEPPGARRPPVDRERSAETRSSPEDPDVLLDVPVVKVEEIDLEVDDLLARVSLRAAVLDLLDLNVGADVALGRVKLTIKGVEAQALLKVRLDNVSEIIRRVLETIDENPEILTNVTRGVGTAAGDIGRGAGGAVRDLGRGAEHAVEDVGEGAGGAVRDVGTGAGGAVRDVGEGAGGAVRDVGTGTGGAVRDVGEGAGGAVRDVGEGAGGAVRDVGEDAGGALGTGAAEQETADLAAGELVGALAKKSVQAGRDAAKRAAEAMKNLRP